MVAKPSRVGRLETWLHLGDCATYGPKGRRWVRRRPRYIAVVVAFNLLAFHLAGLSTARLLTMLGLIAVPLTIAIASAVHPRLQELTPTALWLWLAGVSVLMTGSLALTGGLRSPLIAMLVVPFVLIVAFWGWTLPARILIACFVGSVVILSVLPSWVTGAPIRSPHFEIIMATNLLIGTRFGCRTVLELSEGLSHKSRALETVRERALAAATSRVRSLEQVGAKVAHELKNPLAAIKSLLQLERSQAEAAGTGDEKSARRLEVMTREVARMEGILREYLSFSRPLEDLRVGPVNLATVADNVLELLEGRAAAAGVRLQRTGGQALLAGDARRLEEALLNLVSNALEASGKGGNADCVTVDVAAGPDGAEIVVKDSGVGMTPAVLEKIGTPFFTTRAEGNGLGVVLARSVITQHGGRLDFSSEAGIGTTATISLPATLPISGAIAKGQVDGPRAPG